MGNRCSVKIMRSDPRSWWSRLADGAPSSCEDDGLVCVCVCVCDRDRDREREDWRVDLQAPLVLLLLANRMLTRSSRPANTASARFAAVV